jgi:PTS system fructose-specific IIA component/PTS system nitrogen regulatory IIA component
MVETLADQGKLPHDAVPQIVANLLQREQLGTTGLGRGLALPHLRSRHVACLTGLIAIAPDGVDFASLDGWPTRVVILVLSPFAQREIHVAILGRLATLFSNKTLQYSVQVPRTPQSLLRFLGIPSEG